VFEALNVELRFSTLVEGSTLRISLSFAWNHFGIAGVAWSGVRVEMHWVEGYSEWFWVLEFVFDLIYLLARATRN
jgi:hypothetical protein